MQVKSRTIDTLRALLYDLKIDALWAGRYPPPQSVSKWEKRDKKQAFRCIAYCQLVRRIGALEDAISELESKPGEEG